jgi:hypothetical protein
MWDDAEEKAVRTLLKAYTAIADVVKLAEKLPEQPWDIRMNCPAGKADNTNTAERNKYIMVNLPLGI